MWNWISTTIGGEEQIVINHDDKGAILFMTFFILFPHMVFNSFLIFSASNYLDYYLFYHK